MLRILTVDRGVSAESLPPWPSAAASRVESYLRISCDRYRLMHTRRWDDEVIVTLVSS